MNIEVLDAEVAKLNFTKEEEFKVKQTNELILMLDSLRRGVLQSQQH